MNIYVVLHALYVHSIFCKVHVKYNSETLKRWQCPKYRDCYCWFGEWFLIFSICSFKLASPKRSWTLNCLYIATGFEYFSSCSRNLYTATWAPRLFSCIIPGAILIGVEKWLYLPVFYLIISSCLSLSPPLSPSSLPHPSFSTHMNAYTHCIYVITHTLKAL